MKTACIAALAATSFAAPAWAEEADGNTIIVVGQAATTAAEDRAAATPGGADVVSHEDYADRTVVSLRDALAFSPGVYAQPRYGQEVRISIRGSGISRGFHMRGLTLLQDGIPINLADDNGDFQELDPIFFDHLEVYRGGNALRFGSGTLGGAINGVTPTGDNARGIYARLDGGSFDMMRALVSGGFGDEAANAWMAVSADRHDGDRQHAKRRSIRFQGNAGFRLSESISTRFYASFNNIDQQLPGALTQSVALARPKTGNFANNQARDIDSLRLQNRTTFDLGGSTLNVGVFYNAKQLYHPIYQVVDQESADRGVFARWEYDAGLFAATLGGESRWGTVRSKRFINIEGKRGAPTFNADQKARTSTLYGELRLTPLPQVSLIAGGIYADGDRRQDQTLPTAVTGEASFTAFSPKFGVLWAATPDIQIYANYNRSAEFPGFIELAQVAAFVPVRSQRAWTAEVGTRGKLGQLSWDVSFYRATLRRELLQYNVDVNAGFPAATFNADRTLHQGVEMGLSIQPTEWLRLRQIWQYSDFRFRNDAQFADNRLPVIPKHVLRSEARIGTERLHVSPNLEWVPQGPWADYANTHRTPGYALVGISAGATVRDGIDLFVDARNLTGKKAIGDISAVVRYVTDNPATAADESSSIFYPVERQAVYAGVRARF